MSNVNFYLLKLKEDKKGNCPVQVQLTFSSFRIRKLTGIKIKEKYWSPTKQRIKPNLKAEPYNNCIEFNTVLDKWESKTKEIYNYALLNEIPLSKAYIEEQLNQTNKLLAKNRPFFEVFLEFIDSYKAVKAERTVKKHITALNFFKEFEANMHYQVKFESLTLEFFDKFRNYAFIERSTFKKPKSETAFLTTLADNYFASLVASLKTFLTWATDRGFNKNLTYKRFKASEVEIDVIWLNQIELFSLFYFEFNDKRLERIRDVYCFACFTGLRYSDILGLKAEEIRGDFLYKIIKKTRQKEKIALSKFALSILEKYSKTLYCPLPKFSEPKFNLLLKEVCKQAGINTITTKTTQTGGKVITRTVPKYELITSHTARKTFTTLSVEMNMNLKALKSITGHKKDGNFNKYIKITDNLQQQELDNTWNKLQA